MAKVGPNAVNFAIAEMIGQLLTLTTHPNGNGTTWTKVRLRVYRLPEMQKVIKRAEINFWPKKLSPKNGPKMTPNSPKMTQNDPKLPKRPKN